VKLHNLHVLRNTPLHRLYEAGGFEPITLPEYARRVAVFLEHLAPEVAVHRLSAVASRWDEVVAPGWVKSKMGPTQFIRDHLERANTWQGRLYGSAVPPLREGAVLRPEASLVTGGTSWA
jgi:radical SAM superfamily enzyme